MYAVCIKLITSTVLHFNGREDRGRRAASTLAGQESAGFRAPKNRTQRLQMAPNRKPRPAASASAVYGLCFSDLSTASTRLSPTSRTAPIASRPFSPASEITPSRSDFARCHEAVPLAAKMSAI